MPVTDCNFIRKEITNRKKKRKRQRKMSLEQKQRPKKISRVNNHR